MISIDRESVRRFLRLGPGSLRRLSMMPVLNFWCAHRHFSAETLLTPRRFLRPREIPSRYFAKKEEKTPTRTQ